MKMTFLCKLSVLVMLLLFVFACVSCSCGGETPEETTTPSGTGTTTPITTGGTTVTTPITTKEDFVNNGYCLQQVTEKFVNSIFEGVKTNE